MKLFEAIIQNNSHSSGPNPPPLIAPAEHASALPVAVLTCIDARLNHLFPDVLGLTEEHFIWLRNAGNVITGPMSSMMRSLALACVIKGAREIAVVGHTDCRLRQTSVLELTDRFQALGIPRSQLPDNLNEFFGLFASERQNVIGAVQRIRSSPIIGQKIPVHGLLVDVVTRKLDWLVNGYAPAAIAQAQSISPASTAESVLSATLAQSPIGANPLASSPLDQFHAATEQVAQTSAHTQLTSTPGAAAATMTAPGTSEDEPLDFERLIDRAKRYRVIGSDLKQYGPVLGAKVLEWLAEGRIDGQTQAQAEGDDTWKPIADPAKIAIEKLESHLPPQIAKFPGLKHPWKKGR